MLQVRSSMVSSKFSNQSKLETLNEFIVEYQKITKEFIDILWGMEKIQTLLDKKIISKVNTWLSARALQAAGKQASGIVRGTRVKQERRAFMIKKLKEEGKFKQASYIEKKIENTRISKPQINKFDICLDQRFIKIDLDNPTSFDGWITLTSLGNKKKIILPFKKTKHFNELYNRGKLVKSVRISREAITFIFTLPEREKKTRGLILGVDIGINSTLTTSTGFQPGEDIHGWNQKKITERLCRRRKGSKGFKRTSAHLLNYQNWAINRLDLKNIGVVRREALKNVGYGQHKTRLLSHWNYKNIIDKLEDYCSQHGVRVETIAPAFTSQRCSACGWVQKSNRRALAFKCQRCSYAANADVNAAINIGLNLPLLKMEVRMNKKNRIGFYWNCSSQENIVPGDSKTSRSKVQQN